MIRLSPFPAAVSTAPSPMVRELRRLATALLVLFAAGQGMPALASDRPSLETYLLRVGLAGETVVFVPLEEISSPEDAGEYIRWATAAHGEKLRAVWDIDPVAVRLSKGSDAGFLLREQDEAVAPSGLVLFVVDTPPKDDGVEFSLKLAHPIKYGMATPDVCFTNALVLSREKLFKRWQRDLDAGNVDAVRAEIRRLGECGRYEVEGGVAWQRAVWKFVAETRELWLPVQFENRTGHSVSVVCGDQRKTLAAGEAWDVFPSELPEDGSVRWSARDDDGLCEKDFESSEGGGFSWNPIMPCLVPLEGNLGTLRPVPRVLLEGTIPEELLGEALDNVRLCIAYGDDNPGSETESRILKGPDGPYAEIEPHRPVASLMLMAPGYRSSPRQFEKNSALCRGDTLSARSWKEEGFALRKKLPPWPTRLVVRNVSGRDVNIHSDHLKLHFPLSCQEAKSEESLPLGDSLGRVPELEESLEYTFDLVARTEGAIPVSLLETNLVVRRGEADLVVEIPPPPKPVDVAPVSEEPAPSPLPDSVAAATEPEATVAPPPPETPSAPPVSAETPSKPERKVESPGVPIPRLFPESADWKQANSDLERLLKQAKEGYKEVQSNAVEELMAVQGFWKRSGSKEKRWISTFRKLVAHCATCPDGCPDCDKYRTETLGKGFDPKTEAFDALGRWTAENQIRERNKHVPMRDWSRVAYRVRNWSDRIVELIGDPSPANCGWASRLLEGREGEDEDKKNGMIFRSLYVHVEMCKGCVYCEPYRFILGLPTFEERRNALFSALLRNERMYTQGNSRPPTEDEIRQFFNHVKNWKETKR